MNKQMLPRLKGKELRLRPKPISISGGNPATKMGCDDKWLLADIIDKKLRLQNMRTNHVLEIGLDHVHKFFTPDFLLLFSQVFLQGMRVFYEPLLYESFTDFEAELLRLLGKKSPVRIEKANHIHCLRLFRRGLIDDVWFSMGFLGDPRKEFGVRITDEGRKALDSIPAT
ncbi:MAG: hypothetical protein HY748_13530 [Elusimicrobia bacterium]|nr:hypothetical protein [Elusimicrobiota bacterium]